MRTSESFEQAAPQDILRWAVETYRDQLVVVTSFQPTGIVAIHMLQDIAPQVPVLTLDTGLLFPETYALIDEVQARFHIDLIRVEPEQSLAEQTIAYGDSLWQRDPDTCCQLRKVQPLNKALRNYGAWITGLRRDQSAERANTPIVSHNRKNNLTKICPLANWTETMIWTYIEAHDLPYNALHDQGYHSIGCWPCTETASGDDLRSGRWAHSSKTECGIHKL